MLTQSMQLWASVIAREKTDLYLTLSILQLLHSLLSGLAFVQLSKADSAKLAVVSVTDLLKIEEYNFSDRDHHSDFSGKPDDSILLWRL